MGGFLGLGKSAEEKQLEEQNRLRNEEIKKTREEAAIRLAEKKAKKGQETANIKLGTDEEAAPIVDKKEPKVKNKSIGPSSSLGIGLGGPSNTGTGVQL